MRKIKKILNFLQNPLLDAVLRLNPPPRPPKLPLYSLKEFQGIASRRDAHQRYPHNHPDQPAPHTAADSRAGTFP